MSEYTWVLHRIDEIDKEMNTLLLLGYDCRHLRYRSLYDALQCYERRSNRIAKIDRR